MNFIKKRKFNTFTILIKSIVYFRSICLIKNESLQQKLASTRTRNGLRSAFIFHSNNAHCFPIPTTDWRKGEKPQPEGRIFLSIKGCFLKGKVAVVCRRKYVTSDKGSTLNQKVSRRQIKRQVITLSKPPLFLLKEKIDLEPWGEWDIRRLWKLESIHVSGCIFLLEEC